MCDTKISRKIEITRYEDNLKNLEIPRYRKKLGSMIGSEEVCDDRNISEDLIVINRKKMNEISLKQFTSSAF